jgi:hypothetical protein
MTTTTTPLPRHDRFSHHVLSSFTASVVFSIMLFVAVAFAQNIGAGMMARIWEWWAFICGIYIVTQIVPLTRYDPLEERREKADLISSIVVAGVTFIGIPVWYFAKGEWPIFWAWKIWISTIPTSVADIMIMMILYKISRATVRTTTV